MANYNYCVMFGPKQNLTFYEKIFTIIICISTF